MYGKESSSAGVIRTSEQCANILAGRKRRCKREVKLRNAMADNKYIDTDRKGDWLSTFTGRMFWPMDPRVGDFDIRDIAHGLSLTCRFAGQCRQFYSVAQHCVIVALRFKQHIDVRTALLHDAAEAYIGDLATPVKRSLPDYKVCEDNILRCISEQFNTSFPISREIKEVDYLMLHLEAHTMMNESQDWIDYDLIKGQEMPDIMTSEEAEQKFLDIFQWCKHG